MPAYAGVSDVGGGFSLGPSALSGDQGAPSIGTLNYLGRKLHLQRHLFLLNNFPQLALQTITESLPRGLLILSHYRQCLPYHSLACC